MKVTKFIYEPAEPNYSYYEKQFQAELRVEIDGKTLVVRGVYPYHIPLKAIQRSLEVLILDEIDKELFQ